MGDEIVIHSAGGGGYGDPGRRSRDLWRDLAEALSLPISRTNAMVTRVPRMGEWRDTNTAWYKLQLVYCSLCGQVIPRRIWVADVDGEQKIFCGEACEHLYRDYWLVEGAGEPSPPAPLLKGRGSAGLEVSVRSEGSAE